MKRIAVAVSVATLCGAVLVPLRPIGVGATALCNSPHVDSITATPQALPQHGPAGSVVTINGSGFSEGAFCTLQVKVGGDAHQVTSPSTDGSHITFTTGAGWDGLVTVTLYEKSNTNNANTDPPHLIYVTDPSFGGLDNTKPPVNATVNLLGQGFTFNAPGVTTSANYYWIPGGPGGGCAGAPSGTPTISDDTHIALAMPNQYCDGNVDVFLSIPLDANHVGTNDARNVFKLTAAGFDIAPRVAGMSRTSAAPGETVTVTGSGFGNQGGSATLNGTPAAVQSWGDTAATVVVPSNATGGTLTLVRNVDKQSFSPGSLGVNAAVNGVSPAQGSVGDTISINGAGFGTQAGTLSLAGTSPTVQSWSPTRIVFTVPDGVPPGATTIAINTNGTAAPSPPPTFKVLPRITSITPAHAAPGALIEVDGVSFGTQQGTVQIGGQDGSVTLWGDKSVLVVMSSSVAPGQTTVVLTPPNSDPASSAYTVDVPPPTATPQPGGGGGGSNAGGGHATSANAAAHPTPGAQPTPGLILPDPAGPVIAQGPVQFVKPTPPPGPVSLRLDAGASQADPGTTVPFTITLMAFGKPVSGAPVDIVLVIEPGRDASLDPSHAVTDAQGQVKGTLQLSKTPGDHIVLARSGIYSDEVRVVGRGATTAAATGRVAASAPTSVSSPFASVRSPVLWALVACLLLFGAGVGLNLATAPAAAGEEGWTTVGAKARRDAGYALRRAALGAGSAVRFGAALVAVLAAHSLGAVRRR